MRRAVLGDAHIDKAMAGTTEFTREFQELITRYAWARFGLALNWTGGLAGFWCWR